MAELADTDRVELSIDGKAYAGWTEIRIVRALDTLCGEFELGLTDRERTGDVAFPLRAGSSALVKIGDETVITGWIDRLEGSISGRDHGITVAGRDKAGDLIDCSAIAKPGSWTNVSMETIAAALAKPFGITVTAKASTGAKIRKFSLQQGESVQSAIERLARYRGLLAISTADGHVELITPEQGSPVADLIQGKNILLADGGHVLSERFSQYVLKGQASGDDEVNGRAASAPSAEAKDPAVTRYRPLLIIGEEQSDIASLKKRAEWEAATRAGRAQQARVTVPGWRRPDGKLWTPNVTVSLTAPALFMDGRMLVVSAALMKDERGTVTDLVVSPPTAFSQLAIPENADGSEVKRKRGRKKAEADT